ncbi:hypothetical protein Rsub_01219 [Raphidocelis subcapitata]|uniref:Uncharacterized protein n=1 Tax=Raphidocelis subcapitata TaxID=307507 RepID=A0A2V0NM27_9CHLO|nr:hypothetical protein Rsub_01219 [Raphidocelis subcapitata]|eukprot:GBF88506.1 hypothetical protein Rsub_01219 [Raphidocelis subcapitata]
MGPPKQQQQHAQPAKKQKLSVEYPAPAVASLFTAAAGLATQPSPGAMHGCRVAAADLPRAAAERGGFASVFASGPGVFLHSVLLPSPPAPCVGREGLMMPALTPAPPAARLRLPRHAGEVQAVALRALRAGGGGGEGGAGGGEGDDVTGLVLATADAYGIGTLARVALGPGDWEAQAEEEQREGDAEAAAAAAVAAVVESTERIEPEDPLREGGWAGAAFSHARPSLLAVARGCARDLTLYDGARRLRTMRAATQPYALAFLPAGAHSGGGDALALAEGNAVSVWDVRAGERGGCVQRLLVAPTGSPLYALAWSGAQGGLLGAAGSERAVQLIDPRRWRCLDKWAGATRQAIHHLSFLTAAPEYACASGLDSEVVCGCWVAPPPPVAVKPYTVAPGEAEEAGAAAGRAGAEDGDGGDGGGGGGAFSYRGDSRWLGVAKAAGTDVLAGFSASGRVTYARITAGVAVQPAGGSGRNSAGPA